MAGLRSRGSSTCPRSRRLSSARQAGHLAPVREALAITLTYDERDALERIFR